MAENNTVNSDMFIALEDINANILSLEESIGTKEARLTQVRNLLNLLKMGAEVAGSEGKNAESRKAEYNRFLMEHPDYSKLQDESIALIRKIASMRAQLGYEMRALEILRNS